MKRTDVPSCSSCDMHEVVFCCGTCSALASDLLEAVQEVQAANCWLAAACFASVEQQLMFCGCHRAACCRTPCRRLAGHGRLEAEHRKSSRSGGALVRQVCLTTSQQMAHTTQQQQGGASRLCAPTDRASIALCISVSPKQDALKLATGQLSFRHLTLLLKQELDQCSKDPRLINIGLSC